MQAQGSVLTNKYAEGYPGRRYYGGCEYVDVVEQLAIDRVKALFGAEFANVQPHSGASGQHGGYFALLQPGDTILGLDLAHGGHLTHGMRINYSRQDARRSCAYHVNKDDYLVDMDEVARLAREHRPKMIIAGWSAYSRQLDFARFREIADEVGACCSSTWRTSPGWSRPACTPRRCRTRTSSRRRPTRPSAARAAA